VKTPWFWNALIGRRRLVSALTTDDYLDLRLAELLERLSADGSAPGGGSAAALTVALSASLVGMVARCSRDSWAEAAGVVAQAEVIGDRAVALAHVDGRAWEEALEALHRSRGAGAGDPRRDFELEQKLERAAAAPLEIAELGADAAELAALAAERGDGTFRADAAAAAALAAGGAGAAAHLVQVNLGVRPGDARLARARASEQAARDAADRLLAPIQ
jgi:formiminotetrahydrofolate cyclodeaminase